MYFGVSKLDPYPELFPHALSLNDFYTINYEFFKTEFTVQHIPRPANKDCNFHLT